MGKFIITIFISIFIIATVGAFSYGYRAINQQKLNTTKLQDQLMQLEMRIQESNDEDMMTAQNLREQINLQKILTEEAQKQAQDTQKALASYKEQQVEAAKANNNTLPNINTRAIVLIICLDGNGYSAQTGSGTIITADGYVLTSKHVVTDRFGKKLECLALMNDGGPSPSLQKEIVFNLTADTTKAPKAKYYSDYDAAILKIESAINNKTDTEAALPNTFPFIRPDTKGIKQGQTVFIFGYPAASNLIFNVTRGIVSSLSTNDIFINTDAIIDRGNSGGAAITSDGRLVGIPTQKYIGNNDYLGQILNLLKLAISI